MDLMNCGDLSLKNERCKMNSKKYNKDIIKPIIFSIIYTIHFYLVTKFSVENNILMMINDITINNIVIKFMYDSTTMILIPSILIIIYRKRLIEFKLNFKYMYLLYALITILAVSFVLHGDFTIKGIYQLFFSLVIVGFGEEFIYRGYIYNQLTKHNRLLAIIISGFFFGILHAILPGLVAGNSLGQIIFSMRNEIGGGILMGYYFIYILDKSNSLYIPIFVHAIMNYAITSVSIITMIFIPIYLYTIDKKAIKENNYNEIL
jgi:membrane protease YdiL (CAAX protease family)